MTTTQTTFQKQYPLALVALGKHMTRHQLPVPAAVDVVEEYRDQRTQPAIQLRLPAYLDQQQKWLDSVHVDGLDSEERELGARIAYSVRLPGSGFRFILVALVGHPRWAPAALGFPKVATS